MVHQIRSELPPPGRDVPRSHRVFGGYERSQREIEAIWKRFS